MLFLAGHARALRHEFIVLINQHYRKHDYHGGAPPPCMEWAMLTNITSYSDRGFELFFGRERMSCDGCLYCRGLVWWNNYQGGSERCIGRV